MITVSTIDTGHIPKIQVACRVTTTGASTVLSELTLLISRGLRTCALDDHITDYLTFIIDMVQTNYPREGVRVLLFTADSPPRVVGNREEPPIPKSTYIAKFDSRVTVDLQEHPGRKVSVLRVLSTEGDSIPKLLPDVAELVHNEIGRWSVDYPVPDLIDAVWSTLHLKNIGSYEINYYLDSGNLYATRKVDQIHDSTVRVSRFEREDVI